MSAPHPLRAERPLDAALPRTALPERNLDLLRAIAVSLVVAQHAIGMFAWEGDGAAAIGRFLTGVGLGRMGVLLFFVHTALVLMSSLERLEPSASSRARWAAAFYVRRGFRIYPLAVLAILCTVAFRWPPHVVPPIASNHYTALSARGLAANLLLAQNLTGDDNVLGVLWSLPLEVQMYALLPICYLVARKRRSWGMAVMLASAVLGGALVLRNGFPGAWRLNMLTFAPCFVSGVLAYHLARRHAPRLPGWCWPLCLGGATAIFVALGDPITNRANGWVPCVLLGLCVPFVADLGESVVTRTARQLATYSYGVYLWHGPALWIAFSSGAFLPIGMRWSLAAAIVAALSIASYHLIEQPLVRIGARLGERILATTPNAEIGERAPRAA